MPSTLGWLDHDPHERERTARILALFKETNAVDELGLGSIRESFSDELFPGTSTIQTRLRYMLFVPWIYQRLEDKRTTSADVARKARKLETDLVQPLLDAQEEGVLGRLAREHLKLLPSTVYWNGLASWGIRKFDGSKDRYHQALDRLYVLRSSARRRDDDDLHDGLKPTWDPGLPEPPADFPETLSFNLRRIEAEYLRDRICTQHPESMLAWLAKDRAPVPDVDFIWLHPQLARFSAAHRELVLHAELFAKFTYGAAVLYNLELARRRKDRELCEEHEERLRSWVSEVAQAEVRAKLEALNLPRLWELVMGKGHQIGQRTREFVGSWLEVARAAKLSAADGEQARALVRNRERALKGSRSRFDNQRALDQWSGYTGLRVASFRWPDAQVFIRDMQAGLQREEET